MPKTIIGMFSRYYSTIDRLFVILLSIIFLAMMTILFFVYRNFQAEKTKAFQNEAFYSAKIYAELIQSHIVRLKEKIYQVSLAPSIIKLDATGESMMIDLYDFHKEKDFVRAISFVSSDMQTLFSVPWDLAIETDASAQKHLLNVTRDKRPVISNPFTLSEGFKVVALSVPVFRNEEYAGSISMLIDFDALSKAYLGKVQVRGTGKTWMIDSDGNEMLLPGYSEKISSISLLTELRISLLKQMKEEKEGITTYQIMENKKEVVRYLSYTDINLSRSQRWFVCIDASAQEINDALPRFEFLETYCLYPSITFVLMAGFLVIGYILVAKHYACMLQKQLIQAQKMETSAIFVNGIAHDFNNIVQLMKGIPVIIQEGGGRASEKDLKLINDLTDRASKLTVQLTGFYRRTAAHESEIDFNKCIEDTATILQRFFEKKISVKLGLGQNLPSIHASASQIEQLLMNLCINARDAMPEGGTIQIKTELIRKNNADITLKKLHQVDHIILSISDNGAGMSKEVKNQIFEPFFTTKGAKGTGIGLSTVIIIVDNLHGRIFVDSEEGKGTKFTVYIPAEKIQQ
ncbi:MAG: hypothetical protein A2X45_17625 [Lentisphaerae bacterium GWF2_50_93]|nr:MAG: hypothetical protein A2X45_17625 [Lentisphaerae bacterium GWF2_50_93]